MLDAFLFSFELDKFLTVDQYLCFFLFLSEQLEEKLKEQTAELKKTDVATK